MNEKRRPHRVRFPVFAAALAAFLLAGAFPLAAQEAGESAPRADGTPTFYLHISGRLAGDFMSCPGINDFVAPFKGGGFGVNVAGGLRAGFRNIVQIEYRMDISYLHDLTMPTGETNHEMTNTSPKTYLAKFNPLFWTGDPGTAWFLVFGLGRDVKYYDKNENGWKKGDMTVLGLEYDKISRNLEAGASLEYRTVTYNQFDLPDFGSAASSFKASFIVAAVHFGIGLGF